MWRIDAQSVAGGTVRLAPLGTEDGPEPCLVWVDPNPEAMVRFCKIQDAAGQLVTAKTEKGLRVAAERLKCTVDALLYLP